MTRPLGVGLQLPEVERPVRWREQLAIAQLAESVGFDSLWVGDHLLYEFPDGRTGPWEAWSQLAALAAATQRVLIGPLVAVPAFHTPVMFAKKAITVDEISAGRLWLGLGAGWNRVEFEAYGFPFDRRIDRFEEAFGIIRRLLRGERVDAAGEFHSVRGAEILPSGPRPLGPPVMIGSTGERMLAMTLPYVSAWNAWWASFGNTPRGVRPLLDRVDRIAESVGRDPGDIDRTVALLVQLPGGEGRKMGARHERVDPIGGSPREIAEALAAFADVGIAHVQLVVDPITEASVEALADVLAVLDG